MPGGGSGYPGSPAALIRNNPLCVASLALGIASIVFLCGPFLGLVIAAGGIICGVLGMKQVDERPDEFTGRNLGQIGLVLSIIGGVLSIGINVFWIRGMWWWF